MKESFILFFFQWPIHQYIFVGFRTLLSVYCLVWLIKSGFCDCNGGAKWFIYLTNWSYSALTLHFFWGAVVSFIHAVKQQRPPAGWPGAGRWNEDEAIGPSWYHRVSWLLHDISAATAITVTVLYWGAVYDPDSDSSNLEIDINMHTLNSVFILSDIFVGAIPLRVLHVIYSMLFTATYVIFTVIYWGLDGTNALGQKFVYSALDYSNHPGTAALYITLSLLVGLPVVQLLLYGWWTLKMYTLTKCCSHQTSVGSTTGYQEEGSDPLP